jgi:hypothetical protein
VFSLSFLDVYGSVPPKKKMISDSLRRFSDHGWLPIPTENLQRLPEVKSLLKETNVSSEKVFYRRLFNVKTTPTQKVTDVPVLGADADTCVDDHRYYD